MTRGKNFDKLTESLSSLIETFLLMEEEIKEDLELEEDNEDQELETEVSDKLMNSVRMAIESVMDTDDYTSEEIAGLIANLMEGLQEIDPDAFDIEDEDIADDEEDELEDIDIDEDEDFDEDEYEEEEFEDEDY